MKTLLFTVFLMGWDIRNQQISYPKISKNHVCNPNMVFGASNDRKYQKVIQNGVQRCPKLPKMSQKSSKIHPGTFQGPFVCICDSLDCKMVPKWCSRTSKMIQNGHLGTLKGANNSTKPNNHVYNKQIQICHFLIDFNP